ncbi:MAG: hypothetical protein JRG92_18480 [Deltaproteobacteria bacterium]|nr:hypothetical protein [Deltaproteobacteria bacterium]
MATATDEYGKGFERWSLQAWLDYLMVKIMMGRVGDVIPKTYMPILRLVSEDVDKVDDAYQQICALREPVRLLESPRDKWRKMYSCPRSRSRRERAPLPTRSFTPQTRSLPHSHASPPAGWRAPWPGG